MDVEYTSILANKATSIRVIHKAEAAVTLHVCTCLKTQKSTRQNMATKQYQRKLETPTSGSDFISSLT